MILILKSATTNQKEEIAWSEEAVNFLLRYGAIPQGGTDCSISNVFIVQDPREAANALYLANLI